MNLERLLRQLRRDTKANPKKTAVLALMILVALYFWAPLVWGWIAPSDASKSPDVAALILTDDPIEPAQQQAANWRGSAFRWDKVRPKMREDRLMTSATFDSSWADPFALRQPEPAEAVIAIAPPVPGDEEPREAGLVLTSVLIGSRKRTATINGRPVHEGDDIKTAAQGDTPPLVFRVERIGHSSVDLLREGRRYRLELRLPQLASGDLIEPMGK